MKIIVICKYCGFTERKTVYSNYQKDYFSCTKCKDKDLEIIEDNNIDYYQGSPPFPPKDPTFY